MSGARIHERGYLRYDGPRGGQAAAVRALVRHSVLHLLGRKRRARAKLLPLLVGGIAYVPAIVLVGLVVLLPRDLVDLVLPRPGEYLGFVMTAVYLFVALGTPAVLCPDRRHGTLALYLASPLSRDTYLAARATALLGFLAIVTIGPSLLLLIGLTLLGAGPDGPTGVVVALGSAVAAGAVVALVLGALAMALCALTDRQATAAAFVILWLLMSPVLAHGILRAALDLPEAVVLLDVGTVALESVASIYGTRGGTRLPAEAVLGAAVLWTGAAAAFTRWRYQRIRVTR